MTERRLSVAEACDAIMREIPAMPVERVRLADSHGRVLAEDARSPLALPPWDNASMDGYAVRAADVRGATAERPVRLRVVETIAAGVSTSRVLGEAEAMRIMTGAPVPAGADSVVRVEDTDAGLETVAIRSERDALRNVRPRGEDIAAGQVAVRAHTELRAAHLGFLASIGASDVPVFERPRVAILASGDELVDVDRFAEVLDGGAKIVSSNSYALSAAVVEAGGVPVSLGLVGDDAVALRDALARVDADLLLTTGGISVGAFDFTRDVLTQLGLDLHFWMLRIRPGAPLGFGMFRGTPWLGLPGNPVSTLVTFELFARPAIRKLRGLRQYFRRAIRVRLGEPVSLGAPLTHFLRARLEARDGGWEARLTGPQGSGLASSMAHADALLILEGDQERIEAGTDVNAILLGASTLHDAAPPAANTGRAPARQ